MLKSISIVFAPMHESHAFQERLTFMKKQHFTDSWLQVWGKSPVFQPKPTGKSAYKYVSSHSQLFI